MPNSPTIRSRLTLLISLSVLFWFVFSLLLVDRVNRILSFDSSRRKITELRSNITKLGLESEKLVTGFRNITPGSSKNIGNEKIEEICISLSSSFDELKSTGLIVENVVLQRNVNDAADNVKEIERLTSEFAGLYYERGDLGIGLLNQWYSGFLSVQNIRRSAGSGKAATFLDKVIDFSMLYLINKDPDELEKLIDFWQLEMALSIPANSSGSETEAVLSAFIENTRSLSAISRKAGGNIVTGLRAEINFYLLQLDKIAENLDTESALIYEKNSHKILHRFIFLILLFGGLIIAAFYRVLLNSSKSVDSIRNFLNELKSGKIPEKLSLNSSDDLNEMADSLNKHVESLSEKINFADQIGENDIQGDFAPVTPEDALGNSLLKMANRLREAENEDSAHKEEEARRSWLSQGMAEFGEIFRSERENLEELAFKVIKNLVKYIKADQGAIYLNNTEEAKQLIDMVAAFAFDRRKYLTRQIAYGEGLVGTCALEMETIYLTEIPENYFEITSGIGQARPRCLLIVPLKLENELFGILELASFRKLESHEKEFVEQLGESIATTLAAVRINEKTVRLLEKSQMQAEEMAKQEEKMRRNVQELQNAQEESRRKESEITGILNAVNSSSLVAEYSTSGRFADINEKFLFLLESPRDQIIGKHHSEFAVTDKYSPEYKEFWKKLREGETISQIEHFRLFNGNEIWLNQTYTPILDKNQKPYKILNIAHDITQSRKQQESLENQASEIIRKSIDMETLNSAVDTSIIKCELSGDGIIVEVNDNYLETTGHSRKEILGKNLRLFLRETEKQQFEKIWSEVTKEKTYTGVIRRTRPTGEEVWLMATFSPVKDEEGEIYKVYFLAQDITEKKLKYQLLEDANAEIERLRQLLQEPESH